MVRDESIGNIVGVLPTERENYSCPAKTRDGRGNVVLVDEMSTFSAESCVRISDEHFSVTHIAHGCH